MDTVILVPARLASTRFPRKLLAEVRGLPLIQWTAERIRQEAPDFPLFFAVAEEELAGSLRKLGYEVVLTDPGHPSGTDRLAEANRSIGAKVVVNVQADEPLITGAQIATVARLAGNGAAIGTLATPFASAADFLDPSQVKVLVDTAGFALYFSRAPLPRIRDSGTAVDDDWVRSHRCLRHLGIYSYDADFLQAFSSLTARHLEEAEKLEQLRALENGFRIRVGVTDEPTIGIDTPEDLERFAAAIGTVADRRG